MPAFFHLENRAMEPGRAEAEVTAIVAYLFSLNTPQELDKYPGNGDVERGRAIVGADFGGKGCMGCHNVDEFKNKDVGDLRHGPDLSGIGSKVTPDWLYTWIRDPKRLWADTNMPSLRLTDGEAADVVAYQHSRELSGVFQIAAAFANQQLGSVISGAAAPSPEEAARDEVDLLADLSIASGRPVTFALSIINDMPGMANHVLELIGEANRRPGVSIAAQIFPRPIGILFGLDLSLNPFKLHPAYSEIEHLPLLERVGEMRRAERRALILSQAADAQHENPIERYLVGRSLEGYAFAGEPEYEPDPADSLAGRAKRQGASVEETAYDALLEDDGRALLFLPVNNFPGSLDQLGTMLAHDNAIVALGDAGAHLGLICDASYPTFFLTYWTRDRSKGDGVRFTVPEAVNRLTRKPALALGLADRGLIAPGLKADINLMAYDRLHLALPEPVFDLPGGGRRLVQRVEGIEATILSGAVTYRRGQATGALPGRLVRSVA
jgi:N-acyl-D-aspartate/D-glutamate deacylase/cytochrome c2